VPSRLAVIPTRGGSKRVPNKNIRDFCGRSMIGHILQAASGSKLFDTIYVSTESPHVANVSADMMAVPLLVDRYRRMSTIKTILRLQN
jgi:CMP-N-acetylneuraminic acid synthetase